MADRLERKLKRYNRRHKASFPEKECRSYAARRFTEGIDIIVLGHFHQERQIGDVDEFNRSKGTEMSAGAPEKLVAVLPSWKEAYRYFYITADGASGFRSFERGEPLLP
jgi:hypothetical protein